MHGCLPRIMNSCERIMQACENWASALLLHLLSDCSGNEASPLCPFEAEVNNRTAQLAQLLLQIQCTPAQRRPDLAAALRNEVMASLDQLSQVQLGNPQHGHRTFSGQTAAQKAAIYGAEQARREAMSSGVEMDSSSDELPASLQGTIASEEDAAVVHGLRLAESFPVEANYTNQWMNEYFLLNEASASTTVRSHRASSGHSASTCPSDETPAAYTSITQPVGWVAMLIVSYAMTRSSSLAHIPLRTAVRHASVLLQPSRPEAPRLVRAGHQTPTHPPQRP